MVKKVQKVASILAAGALLFGFAACHNDSGSDPTPKVNSVALNQTSLTLVKDSEYTLEATVSVSDGASKEVTWSSSDTDGTYLTLDNGKITTVSATSEAVTVTATSKADFTKSATCSVTVVDSKEEQIGIANAGTYTIDGTTITINEDGTATAADGTTSVSVDVNEDGDIVITIGDKTYTATSDETTGVIDTSTVKNSDGTVVTVEKKAAEEQNDDEPEDAALEATVFWNVTEYVAQVGSDSATSYTENKTYGSVEAIQPFSLRNAAAANSYTLIETNDLSCTGYLQVAADGSIESGKEKKALKFTVPANTKKVSIIAKCGSSSKPANLTLSDGTTAYINKAPSTTYELHTTEELNLSADTVLYLYNAEGSGQGGLNIQAIVLWSEAVVLDPPTATNFTANSTAEGYSITISGADAEKAAGLEYSTDNGTTWTSVTGTTITLTTYGTVKIRYKATDEAGASKVISVAVAEYVDTTKPQADKPAESNFTVTKIVNGEGAVVLASTEGIEYLNASDAWEDAGATYKVTTASTLKFRTKETDEKRASEALEVAVGVYELPVREVTEWDLTDSTATAYNTIPLRSETYVDGTKTTTKNAATILTVSKNDYVGYLGKGLYVHNGTAAEYINTSDEINKSSDSTVKALATTGRGIGFSKYAADAVTGETKATDKETTLPIIETAEAVTGPFKVTIKSNTASGKNRYVRFFVSKTADSLFSENGAYTEETNAGDISFTYAGEDDVFVGIGIYSGDGTFYTEIQKITVTAGAIIPEDEFEAETVTFVDEDETALGDSIELSKTKAVAGFQLYTKLIPTYSTDEVVYSVKESATNGISVSEKGIVSVTSDFSGEHSVTVVATARTGVTAKLTVTVNAVISLKDDSVVTISGTQAIKASGKTVLTANLDDGYTNVASYAWYVDGNLVTDATGKTYEFSNTTLATYKITATATSTANVTTTKSAEFKVIVTDKDIVDVDGVGVLLADSYNYYLSEANIYTKTTKESWSTSSTGDFAMNQTGDVKFTTEGSQYNMSKTERTITLKLSGVAQVDLYVMNSNANRTFTTKIGNADAVTQTHIGSNIANDPEGKIKKKEQKFTLLTGTTGEVTIVIAGGGSSVYPTGVVLKKTADSNGD